MDDPLRALYWENPDDLEVLRVWADALVERGDLRGEYIHLCLLETRTPAQQQRKAKLERLDHKQLVGTARPYLERFELGPHGFVERAICQGDKLLAGLHEFDWLSPRLTVELRTLHDSVVAGLGARSLNRIYHLSFHWGSSGISISDEQLTTLAPAFRRSRHLSLDCAGYRSDGFSPEGLRVLGNTVESLEYLAIRHSHADAQSDRSSQPIDDYLHVIASAPGFETLKAVFVRGLEPGTPALLSSLPNLVHAETSPGDPRLADFPVLPAAIEAAKRGQWEP